MSKKKISNNIINTKKLKKSEKKLFNILIKDNDSFDVHYKKRLSLSVEPDIYNFLKNVSESSGKSVSAVVSRLLALYAVSEGLELSVGKTRKKRIKKKPE